jgi:hypothetical protein
MCIKAGFLHWKIKRKTTTRISSHLLCKTPLQTLLEKHENSNRRIQHEASPKLVWRTGGFLSA